MLNELGTGDDKEWTFLILFFTMDTLQHMCVWLIFRWSARFCGTLPWLLQLSPNVNIISDIILIPTYTYSLTGNSPCSLVVFLGWLHVK